MKRLAAVSMGPAITHLMASCRGGTLFAVRLGSRITITYFYSMLISMALTENAIGAKTESY